jgi:hypothetical protein
MAKRPTANFTPGDAVVEAVRNAETSARNEMVRRTGEVGSARVVAATAGSFHRVVTPVNILAMSSPDGRRLVTRWPSMLRLYANVVEPTAA